MLIGKIAMLVLFSMLMVTNLSLLQAEDSEVVNMNWETLLEALRDNKENSRIIQQVSMKLKEPDRDCELAGVSWELIGSALDKSQAISLFERIAGEKWRQTDYGRLIRIAGNEDCDRIRLNYLKRLHHISRLEKQEIQGLNEMISGIENWLNSSQMTYFGREVAKTQDFDFKINEWSSLYPIACIYRARMLVWLTTNWGEAEQHRVYLGKARKLFGLSRAAFPENRIVRMYLDEQIPHEKQYQEVEGAPKWAVYQREGLERLTDIIEWWIDHRMQENAEYGGGWGDDCEMWRNWIPVLIGFDDPKITWAQTYFSKMLLDQPHLKDGYMYNRITDVEHSAEDISDALTPMMHLEPDNPEWNIRALRLADLMENLWTGRNDRGFLQFKSTYFSVNKVDTSRVKACDTVYHPRAVQPALLFWMRTGDKRLSKIFTAWMDTWVDAATRTERGKPAGILPSAIHWPEGHIGGVGENWWDPKNHPPEVKLYRFPSAMGMITRTLLLTYYMTDDTKYLEPIRSMGRIRLEYLTNRSQELIPGTASWCAAKMDFIGVTVAKYRFLTGNTEFDELLAQENQPYIKYRLWGDEQALVKGLQHCAEALRINFPGYTSEVRYTDRVFRFPTIYRNLGKDIPSIPSPDLSLLYSTATGDPGDLRYFPLNSVRWLTPPRDIAALVTETGKDRFTAELFHFGHENRKMAAELYLLAPGKYEFTLMDKFNRKPDGVELFEVSRAKTHISFELPPRRLYTLRVRLR